MSSSLPSWDEILRAWREKSGLANIYNLRGPVPAPVAVPPLAIEQDMERIRERDAGLPAAGGGSR